MSTPPPSGPLQALPIGATVRDSFRIFMAQLPFLPRALASPMILSLVIAILSLLAPALFGVFMILSLVPFALFGVTWYRLNLLGPQAGAPKLGPTWSRDHTRFFSYVLGFTLLNLAVAPFYLGAAVPDSSGQTSGQALLLALAVMLAVGYLTVRISFVFPAISVGETYSLKDSWNHTKSQGWRLLGALFLVMLPLMAIMVGLAMALSSGLPDAETLAENPEAFEQVSGVLVWMQLIGLVFQYISMALVITMFSQAFVTLTGWVPDQGNVPAVQEPDDDDERRDED